MATDPGTRSPGHLYLMYSVGGYIHRISLALVNGVDIEDVAALRTDAAAFADVFKGVLGGDSSILAWGVAPTGMSTGYEEPFSPAIVGTHASSSPTYYSLTLTMSGNGTATSVGGAKGKTRVVWFTGGTLHPTAGTKQIPNTAEAPFVALANWLHTNLRCFADFYGQKAEPKSYVTCQFNARIQRTHGS